MQIHVPFDQAARLKYPEQVVLVLTVDRNNKVNVITLGWSMFTSHQPPMMAISVGLSRYSHEALTGRDEFVLAFPGRNMAKEALYCGTNSGRAVDKIIETGLELTDSLEVSVPLLKDAVANFECRIVERLLTGDHTIFVGQVVASHRNQMPAERLYTLGPSYQLGYPGL
ncbi:MAG TPA: flavin reductase family protein [archaeon]|nr:flavin reductase family protein [archaeon]